MTYDSLTFLRMPIEISLVQSNNYTLYHFKCKLVYTLEKQVLNPTINHKIMCTFFDLLKNGILP